MQGREGWSKLPAPTHQHASPHITDNYSFRSLRGPIVSGDPRVSDTLWGSPISLSPPLVLQPTPFRVFLLDYILVALVSPGCVFQQLYLSPFLLFFWGGERRREMDDRRNIFFTISSLEFEYYRLEESSKHFVFLFLISFRWMFNCSLPIFQNGDMKRMKRIRERGRRKRIETSSRRWNKKERKGKKLFLHEYKTNIK